MDSITHALYKAVTAEHALQQAADKCEAPFKLSGLQPINKRKHVWDAYADAAATDLHIALGSAFPELLALQLEFIAAGFSPPAGLAECGADVFISPGRVDVYVPTDNGQGTWSAILGTGGTRVGKRTVWEEQTC